MNNADRDPNNPVVIFYPILNLSTIWDLSRPNLGTYKDLAHLTSIADVSPLSQEMGMANPRFPIYIETYGTPDQKKAWDIYASAMREVPL